MTSAQRERPAAPFVEGDLVDGRFRVERVLVEGSSGLVVSAAAVDGGERVAIKFMTATADAEMLERFEREARTAAMLQSPHVARVLGAGELRPGAPYIVMELLEGTDLCALLDERGPLPVAAAVSYVMQAAAALEEAHARGLVHRDLKPSNLFLARSREGSEVVKVLDFGVVKSPDESAFDLTATGSMLGSPCYMAPEQVRDSKKVDPRVDVWGLGATLYELLTGVPPFRAPSLPALCAKVVADPHVPLLDMREGIDPELSHIVDRCLAKDPAARWGSARALGEALAPHAAGALTPRAP